MMTVVATVDRRKSGLKGEGIQRRRDSDCRRRVFSGRFLNSGDRGRQSRVGQVVLRFKPDCCRNNPFYSCAK
jgi:hypothetical protein